MPDDVSEVGGAELARQLSHVLLRSVWLYDYSVSNDPSGAQGDGLPEYRGELVKIPTPDEAFTRKGMILTCGFKCV